MKKFNQKGFSTVEALIIIVVICALGGVGYYVYSKQQAKQSDKKISVTKQPLVLYTDPTKLYTINHPKDWTIEDLPLVVTGLTPNKQHDMRMSFPGDLSDGALSIMSDKTPQQAQVALKNWEDGVKREPKVFTTTTINGYKTLHRHIEFDDEETGAGREDYYVIINKDQSSVGVLIESKRISKPADENLPDFDNTDKLEDFKAIVNSIKFL